MKIWKEMAEKFSYIDGLLFVCMDAPEVPEIASKIKAFPTLVLFPYNNKEGVNWTGEFAVPIGELYL